MPDHVVTLDDATDPPTIRLPDVFNIAVPFIDRHAAEGREAAVAIRTVAEEVTYGELAERVNRCGNALKTLDISAGERMLMVVKDCPEFFYLFWGAIKAGAVPVPVNTVMREDDYRYLIEDSGCRAVVYSPEFASTVEAALEAASHKPAHALMTEGAGALGDHMATASADLTAARAAPGDDCFWLYSSGSTGNPKGVVHAHRDMVFTGQSVAAEMLGMVESDSCFSMSKLFHSYGFGNAFTFPLWVGGTAILSDRRVTPDMTFEIIEKFRPTLFFGVPTLYAQQLQAMADASPDFSSLRLCISAGEALPGDVFRRWRENTGLTIVDGLGSTEMLHIFIGNTLADHRPGTSGRVVPRYEVQLVDEDGKQVKPGEIGTVLVKGGSNAKYYWNNPEKTAATMLGEWLDTGDMYYQDEDGYFVNCGRGDDMMKVGGLWCSPFEIEARLIEHPKVLEAAVVGRTDENDLIKPEAFVVLNDAGDAGEEMIATLTGHCRDGLDHYKYPRWFNFVEELPKTVTGKIQRFRLRQ
jgi:benzoate-CoA ligase family protein